MWSVTDSDVEQKANNPHNFVYHNELHVHPAFIKSIAECFQNANLPDLSNVDRRKVQEKDRKGHPETLGGCRFHNKRSFGIS